LKILIVDDSSSKIREISRCLCQSELISISDIDSVGDSMSAKAKLVEEYYDFLILDINLPPDSVSEPEKNEGVSFLNHLTMSEEVNLPMHILGITEYKEVLEVSNSAFSKRMWTVIHYDPSSSDWKDKIKEKVNYLNKLTQRNSAVEEADLVLITAVEIEQTSVFNLPIEWIRFSVPNDPTIYYRGEIVSLINPTKSMKVVTALCLRMGMVAAATLTSKMVYHFQPKYMFMVGICAGIEGKTNYGDIIVADPIWSYESGKHVEFEGGSKFLPSPHQVNLTVEVRSQLKDLISRQLFINKIVLDWKFSIPETGKLKVHIGPMASGASVIADGNLIEPIQGQHRQVLGVEMEAYGVMAAAEVSRVEVPKCVVIKSVCDFADSKKSDDWQNYSAYTSSKYFYEYIQWILGEQQ
jgi:nucleoside phosphorylase